MFCKNGCVSVILVGTEASPPATPGGRRCLMPATTSVVFTSISPNNILSFLGANKHSEQRVSTYAEVADVFP